MSTTLEELVVKLEAQNQQFMAAMVASQNTTTKAMEGIQQSIKEMSEQGEKHTSFFQNAISTMAGFVGGSIVMAAFDALKDAATETFKVLITDSVSASSESIDAMNRLKFALAQTGQLTSGAADGFADWANQLQQTTKYEDEAIIKSAAYIQTLGKLDQDGLKRATEGAMNLASALGIDLETATSMVGKAAAGEVGTFGRLGIKIQESSDKATTFANALKAIEALGPAATKEAETYSGSVARLGHGFSEVQEAIGGLITKNVAVVSVMNAVSQVFFNASGQIDENSQALRELVAKAIVIAIDASTALAASIDAVGRIGEAAFKAVESGVMGFGTAVTKAMNLVGLASDETVKEWSDGWKEAATETTDAFTRDTAMGAIGEKFAELGDVAEKGLDRVKAGVVALPEPINNTKKSTDELSASMKALIDQGAELAKGYMEATVSGKAMADEQTKNAENARDMALLRLEAEKTANVGSSDSAAEERAKQLDIEQQFHDAKLEALGTALQAENDAVQAAYDNGKVSKEEYETALTGIQTKYSALRQKNDLDLMVFKKKQSDQEVKDREAQIGVLAGLAQSQNEGAKTMGKAFSVANTIMKTHEGAQSAYAALAGIPIVGPALGAAAAAAVIADGAARISAIRGAKTGIDSVPGIGKGDSQHFMLEPGERVVDGEANKDLKQAIQMILSGQGSGGKVEVEISMKDDLIHFIETKIVERQRLGLSQL